MDFKVLPSRACVTVLPEDLLSVNLDTQGSVALREQAQSSGETWSLDHLATVLTLSRELITEEVVHHLVRALSSSRSCVTASIITHTPLAITHCTHINYASLDNSHRNPPFLSSAFLEVILVISHGHSENCLGFYKMSN